MPRVYAKKKNYINALSIDANKEYILLIKPSVKIATPKSQGYNSRHIALEAVECVLEKRYSVEFALDQFTGWKKLVEKDRAFTKLLVMTTLRHLSEIDAIYSKFLDRPLPRRTKYLRNLLRLGTAQLIFLKTPPHAAVNTSVYLAKRLLNKKFKGLTNALLRKTAISGAALSPKKSARLNTPDWLWQSWCEAYGEQKTLRIAQQHLQPAPTDLTLAKKDSKVAIKLDAEILETGSLRCRGVGQPNEWYGYSEGKWWVQDAAAALPIKLLGNIRGLHVFDLCAAPGGKTAQLDMNGANVLAIDISEKRFAKLQANKARLGLGAETMITDVRTWKPKRKADLVVLDAPCTATGTCRRHPEILRIRKPSDVETMVRIQKALLDASARMVSRGGTLLYITCSLQPEEGPNQIADFLDRCKQFVRFPFAPVTWHGLEDIIDKNGTLRTFPCDWSARGGLDGFYAAALKRMS